MSFDHRSHWLYKSLPNLRWKLRQPYVLPHYSVPPTSGPNKHIKLHSAVNHIQTLKQQKPLSQTFPYTNRHSVTPSFSP